MSAMRLVAIAITLVLTGCCFDGTDGGGHGDDESADGDDAYAGPDATDDFFVFRLATRTHEVSTPARLRARIPSTIDGLRRWGDDAPPFGQVQARLCSGDPAGVSRWLEAASTAARSAPITDVAVAYADIVGFCGPSAGNALRARLTGPLGHGMRETAMLGLAMQGDPRDEALMLDADAFPTATLVWLTQARIGHAFRDTEVARVLVALEAHLRAFTPVPTETMDPCGPDVDILVRKLSRDGHAADLVALHGRLTGTQADFFGLALDEIDDPRGQEIAREACPRVRSAEACAALRGPSAWARANGSDAGPANVDEVVRDFEFDVHAVPASGPERDAVLAALARCAGELEWTADTCLRHLAALDRPQAVTAARAWIAANPTLAPDRDVMRALDAFPEPDGVLRYLRDQGLLGADDHVPDDAVAPLDVLFAAGRAIDFDTETDRYPNEHDTLLVELAALSPATLRGTYFDEILEGAPGGIEIDEGLAADVVVDESGEAVYGDEPTGVYVLHAYDGHTRYEIEAENFGDWYDVDAVVGLLNTLAFERHANVRWLQLATGDQTAIVVVGPEAGLRTVVADGWLVVAPRNTAEAAREAEDEVIQRLMDSSGAPITNDPPPP
jgi:hypothetical protein